MCFVLYIGSQTPLPIIPWDETTRGIHTEALTEHDISVRGRFTLPHVLCIGSDTHCGCGFRNATFQNGSWPEEEWRPDNDTSHVKAQPNHERLIEFIQRYLGGQASCEFYGIWEDDFAGSALSNQTILLEDLADLKFYFRDRGYYSVIINKLAQSSP